MYSTLTWFMLFLFAGPSYSIYLASENVVRENYMTLAAHFTADQLHKALRAQVNELLGVPVMQSIIDGLSFKQTTLNVSLVHEVARRLDAALFKYATLLNKTRDYVAANHRREAANFRAYRSMVECSRISPTLLCYEEQFGTRVNLSSACSVVNRHAVNVRYYPDKNLINVLQSNARDGGIRWQYMIGVQGAHVEYPAHIFPEHKRRHWTPYLSAALPYKRRILILLDLGTIQNDVQLTSLKNVAKILLDGATPGDRFMVMVATGSTVNKACTQRNFVDSTSDQLALLVTFVDNLELSLGKGYSHTRAVQSAYKLFAEEEAICRLRGINDVYYNVLHYVSRGVMSELSEAASVLSAVAEIIMQTNVRIKINTLALVYGEKAPMWSTEFLRNIAEQNFSKYRQSFKEEIKVALGTVRLSAPKGKMVIINDSEHSSLTLPRMFELLRDEHDMHKGAVGDVFWSYPFRESQSTLLSVSTTVYKEQNLTSVVGMDLNLDVIADVVKYTDLVLMAPPKACLRMMVCDLQGRVIVDSKLRNSQPWPLHIADLESWSSADRWLSDHFSSHDLNEGTFELQRKSANTSIKLKYSWKRLNSAPLVVVLALRESGVETKLSLLEKNTRQQYGLDNVAYHRLDIQRDSYLPYCTHSGSLSSMKLGGVYLSPSCFTASSIQRPPSPQWIANYWVYLGDPFGLIRNTGIRSGVREHVGALSGIVSYWRDKAAPLSKEHVVRRYVATSRGVMITYPATVIRDNYDPDLHPWYTRAMKFPGRIVFTGPILYDEVGQIITISTAIFEGQAGSMHNSKEDQVFAVIAMDVPVGFLARLLRSTLSICKESRRCVLFDDLGYLVTRGTETGIRKKDSRAATRSPSADAVEKFHMSHLEPQLATHLIMNPQLVAKKQCIQWATRTVERFFQFNVSFSDALTVSCDENGYATHMKPKSLRAEVIPVPQSNVFLALINESCSPVHPIQAFCPCSVSDRRCLLCSRFDDAECECPCQCPIDVDKQCSSQSSNSSENTPASLLLAISADQGVSPPIEQCSDSVRTVPFTARLSQKTTLPKCIDIRCEESETMESCLGVIGCQWCTTDEDGSSPLQSAYCSPIDQCYSGIKGRRIRSFLDNSSQLTSQWSKATPVGPVAAGIMSVFLIMVIAVYCYRSQVNRLVDTRSLTDSFGAPLCARSADDEDFQFDHDGSASSDDKTMTLIQLASFERASNPPATVRPQYRMSPRTESSDHGYSTMTDRMAGEESECAASSVNVSRQTGRTVLTTIYANEDGCSSVVTTEADVHQIPAGLLLAS
uniref:VWFA and cache domain-containing protein 1 n=1 Tax=Ascaris suum TaxID=6253 RepID=F1KQN7_ASCSU